MNSFYHKSTEHQVEAFKKLAKNNLQNWDIAATANIELIKYRENAVFAIEDRDSGRKYALRIHRAGYHSDEELHSELLWMEALSGSGIYTPAVLPTISGDMFQVIQSDDIPEPRQCDVLEWIEGSQLGSIEKNAGNDGELMVDSYRLVGALQAKLHTHSRQWPLPAGFTRHSWDEEGILGETPFWGSYLGLAALTAADKDLVQLASVTLRNNLAAYGKAPDRYGLIHADFLPENLIVAKDGIRLIDFDDAGFGWHMFDVATSLFYHLGEPDFDDLQTAILEGYSSEAELTDEHVRMLPAFLLARGITYLSWVHTRHETETAKNLTPLIVSSVKEMAVQYLNSA